MTAIALGCSHTAGVGIETHDCYVSVLGQLLNTHIKNLGVPGGNFSHVQHALVTALKSPQPPNLVIAQWPNPIRLTVWHDKRASYENLNNASPAFKQLLRTGEKNFYQPWLDAIVVCNLLCQQAHVPIINIMIEDIEPQYHAALACENIVLHVDRKLPGQTWLMDSAASDNLHHSAHCHQQWANRLLGLLNEYTA